MNTLGICVFAQILLLCNGEDTCSGRRILNERRFRIQEIEGLWYQHYSEDNSFLTSILPTDGKFYFQTFGNNAIKYFYGRNNSGPGCAELIVLDRQRTPRSPCLLFQLISIEAAGEATEIIYSLLPGNDQLLLSICQNPPSCTKRVAIALTRRRYICTGERELFLRKFRELRIPVSLDNQLEPTKNDCTMPGLENVHDKPSRSCSQVTQDAMSQLQGRGQGQGHTRWHPRENRRYRY